MGGGPVLSNRETRGRKTSGATDKVVFVPIIASSLGERHVDEEEEVTMQSSESDPDTVQVHLNRMESNGSSSPCTLKYAKR